MSTNDVSLPLQTYPLLLLGMVGSPMVLVVVLLLTTDGTVDLQDPGEWAGFAIFGVFAAIALAVTVRAFYMTLVGKRVATSPLLKGFALSAPLWWILGALGGVWFAKSISAQVVERRWEAAGAYCAEALGEEGTAAYSACLEIAHECDEEADLGPCGKDNLNSREAAAECTSKTQERLSGLPAHERESLSGSESSDAKTWRVVCILDRMRSLR